MQNTETVDIKGIRLNQDEMGLIKHVINGNPGLLLESPNVRINLAHYRLKKTDPNQVRCFKAGAGSIENAVEHNLAQLNAGAALARPELLSSALRGIDYINYNLSTLKLLSVGPRSEAEIFSFISHGFSPANIRGLDLISYSPYVDLGDMHEMPYADESFDVIVLGWVIAYSHNIPKVAEEVFRVARPGAIIAIGCEYNPTTSEQLQSQGGLLKTDGPRFYHTDDILKHFEGKVENIIFRHDVRKSMKDKVGALMTVFELKK